MNCPSYSLFLVLKMPIVIERNVDSIFLIYAVCKFLSRIILKRLSPIKLESLRKVEKNVKNLIKLKADIKYINTVASE